MGGGPRTFPGGLSKWQYKRMHEKLARQKQRGLLRHEKQLYLARLRSEIRASHLPGAAAGSPPSDQRGRTSSRAHIRALANRFRRPGAEDLWNEDDDPLRHAKPLWPQPTRSLPSGARIVDWKQLDSGKKPPGGGGDWKDWEELPLEQPRAGRGTGVGGNEPRLAPFNHRREYGTVAPWWWQWSSGSGMPSQRKEASFGFFGLKRYYSVMPPCLPRESSIALMSLDVRQLAGVGNGVKETPLALFNQKRLYLVAGARFGRKWRPDSLDEDEQGKSTPKRDLRFGKFGASREEQSEDDELGETSTIRRKWSSAALRNCDMKKDRRALKPYEEENNDLTSKIQELQEEIRNREVLGADRRRYESRGESLLTNKRLRSHHYLQGKLVIYPEVD